MGLQLAEIFYLKISNADVSFATLKEILYITNDAHFIYYMLMWGDD